METIELASGKNRNKNEYSSNDLLGHSSISEMLFKRIETSKVSCAGNSGNYSVSVREKIGRMNILETIFFDSSNSEMFFETIETSKVSCAGNSGNY